MPEGSRIRVLIVDDHAVVRAGLKLLLEAEDDLEAVGEAGTAREAIFEARSTKPDVVLLDVVMPDQSGLDVLPQLLHERPETKVLVLSMQDDPQYVRAAFAAGASGYVLKEAADTEVVQAIREVALGAGDDDAGCGCSDCAEDCRARGGACASHSPRSDDASPACG